MKIGILTLPFNNNYGGYLQAYALMRVLKDMGNDVELIYRQHNKKKVSIIYYIKYIIKVLLCLPHGPLIPTPENILRYRGRNLMPFVDKHISPRTKPLYSSDELEEIVSNGNYDVVVAGSDQLWRPEYVPNVEDFFFSFLKNSKTKVISYAASFGTDSPQYSVTQKNICGEAISRFEAVSVREDTAIDVIKKFGWRTVLEPQVVLDPTMLLPKEHYFSLLSEKLSPSVGKVFCYVLDNDSAVKKNVNTIVSKLGIEKYEIADIQKGRVELPSIETWLSAIRDAEFVVTDSFHGTVFSIIFNKPFFVIVNNKRGVDRFNTLLTHFNLKERIFSSVGINPLISIDWNSVNELLRLKKDSSLQYLSRYVGGVE